MQMFLKSQNYTSNGRPVITVHTINTFLHSWIKRVHLNFHGVWFLLFVHVLFCPLKIKSFIKQLHM